MWLLNSTSRGRFKFQDINEQEINFKMLTLVQTCFNMAKRLHARASKLKAAPGNWCKEAGLCQMQSSSTKYKTWRSLAVNTPAVHCLYPDAYYLALISCLSSSIFKLQSQFYSASVMWWRIEAQPAVRLHCHNVLHSSTLWPEVI